MFIGLYKTAMYLYLLYSKYTYVIISQNTHECAGQYINVFPNVLNMHVNMYVCMYKL